ncbi:MAG: hypothetical protein AAFV98_11630, partial [Chloroflexota bacterium]
DEQLKDVIDALIRTNFIGVETNENEFIYIYEDEEEARTLVKARKLREKTGKEKFSIHPAFRPALESKVIIT